MLRATTPGPAELVRGLAGATKTYWRQACQKIDASGAAMVIEDACSPACECVVVRLAVDRWSEIDGVRRNDETEESCDD